MPRSAVSGAKPHLVLCEEKPCPRPSGSGVGRRRARIVLHLLRGRAEENVERHDGLHRASGDDHRLAHVLVCRARDADGLLLARCARRMAGKHAAGTSSASYVRAGLLRTPLPMARAAVHQAGGVAPTESHFCYGRRHSRRTRTRLSAALDRACSSRADYLSPVGQRAGDPRCRSWKRRSRYHGTR